MIHEIFRVLAGFPCSHMVGRKTSLVTFKNKTTTSASYADDIGTGYTSHGKEICLHSKTVKTTSKSINQIRPVLMS